jgi:hypothetical protein
MKKPATLCLVGIALVLAAGCASDSSTRTVSKLGVIDTIGDSSSKGYVEFYSKSANGLIPIYLVDQNNNSRPLAAVGVGAGNKYVHREGMNATERLRVAAPPGTHTFAISKSGDTIHVPVQADKVTRVELNFDPIDNADAYLVYRLDHTVFDPVAAPEAVGGAPRSE